MTDTKKTKTFVAACLEYFGLQPGQTRADFLRELKALDGDERAALAELLSAELGYNIAPAKK